MTNQTDQTKQQDNVFSQMEKEQQSKQSPAVKTQEQPKQEQVPSSAQSGFDLSDLDDTPVGDKVSYTRESLDGETVTIAKAELFQGDPNSSDDRKTSQNGSVEYVKMTFLLTFDKKNSDDVQHREYLSGARQFVQKDGTLSQPSLWYPVPEGGRKSQVARLWETVAEHLGIKPDQLSNKRFMAFLNNEPKAVLTYEKQSPYPGQAAVSKNLVAQFVKGGN